MRIAAALLCIATGLAGPGLAEAPGRSPRPLPRPDLTSDPRVPLVVTIAGSALAPGASLRPVMRPGAAEGQPRDLIALLEGGTPETAGSAMAVAVSIRPDMRPSGLAPTVHSTGIAATPSRVAQPGEYGPLCGDRAIVGERMAPIAGRIAGCGISAPVRVREIDGIPLRQPATINCDTARALRDWLRESVIPAVGRRGGGVASLRVVASYSCRTRNHQPGARLSEHATGNAVDIAGIGLANGSEVSVLDDWGGGREGRILRQVHAGACGTFGTVLGPDSDRYHRDHFHFDVASYRSGPYAADPHQSTARIERDPVHPSTAAIFTSLAGGNRPPVRRRPCPRAAGGEGTARRRVQRVGQFGFLALGRGQLAPHHRGAVASNLV